MPFHKADLMFASNYVINITHFTLLHKFAKCKRYKNSDNIQVTIIFLHNIALTIYQILYFFSLFIVKRRKFSTLIASQFHVVDNIGLSKKITPSHQTSDT